MLVLLIAAVAFVVLRAGREGTPGGGDLKVTVQPGWSASRIASELQRAGVIDSVLAFRAYLKLQGVDSDFRSGEYTMRKKMGFSELVEVLKSGPEIDYVKLTIPEGLTVEQTAARVERVTHVSAEEFLGAATPSTVRPKTLPDGINSLEGFLYPQTYFIIELDTAQVIVERLVGEFEKRTASVDFGKASSFGLTPFQVLVIASMIEEEAKVDEERAKVAAVIYNRIERKMKLEIDATVQYAVRKYDGEPLTEQDIAVDSPYNTRRYAGLPPGPISSPRLESIQAALNPAETEDLFYVLSPDCRHHTFTETYEEFLREKQQLPDCSR